MAPPSGTNTALPSRSTACPPGPPGSPLPALPSSDSSASWASRRIVSRSPRSTRRAASLRVVTVAAIRALGATRYSARRLRIAEITSWTRANCVSAVAFASSARGRGQVAAASSSSAARPGSFCHSSSVMNGTTGCNNRSAVSKQVASTACAASASAPRAARRGFTASTYQSASSFQTNS